jgi:hypothetical protein
MLSAKEINEAREQIKKEIQDLDAQIVELETFYIEDTKEAVNIWLLRATCSKGSTTTSHSRPQRSNPWSKNKK